MIWAFKSLKVPQGNLQCVLCGAVDDLYMQLDARYICGKCLSKNEKKIKIDDR